MPVLKQISPTGAVGPVWAPKPRPQNALPSASTRAAVAPGGTSRVSGTASDGVSARGSAVRSASVRPVAAITALQCCEGMAPAWRHLRTASVVTPVRRAAASAPPRRSMMSSTLVMLSYLWEKTSRRNPAQRGSGSIFRHAKGSARRRSAKTPREVASGRTSRRSPSRGSDGVDRELGGKAEPVQLARRGASGNPRQCPNPGSACRGPKKGERHGLAFITIHKISVSRWSPCSFRCRRQSGPAAGWRPIC